MLDGNQQSKDEEEGRYMNTSALQLSSMLFPAICHHKCYISTTLF